MFKLFLSLVPELSPKLPGMAVLTTEETEFDKNLCVTDVAVTVKHGETKKLCMDIAGYAMFLETMLFFGNFVSVNFALSNKSHEIFCKRQFTIFCFLYF